ncbi:hypothetical protein [Jeotgalicoccus psychrophilus]|uniref:PBECR3 domain-containing polyvalent protein n=1 Tax=Jeotgalicoccus psychrophilus TaxID=157228 RepID=UPI00047D473F|nr:hypothetical protein [Jeotgalicoccus psychrophilus]
MANLINELSKNRYVTIGYLTKEHCTIFNSFGILSHTLEVGQKIIMWDDRIDHVKDKHAIEFHLEAEYYINIMPNIIANPTFIGIHPKGHGIEYFGYIQNTQENVLVAIKAQSDKHGNLCFRSTYPVKQERLQAFIRSNRVVRCTNSP